MRKTLTMLCSLIAALWLAGCATDPGLVSHWPLHRDTGCLVRDAGPAGVSGLIHEAQWQQYGASKVLAFDGVNDMVDFADAPALDLRGPMTLSVWVMPREIPAREVGIAGKHFTSYLLSYYTNGMAYWYIGSGGNSVSAGLPAGRWTHLVGTFDGQTIRLYANGALASEKKSNVAEAPKGGRFLLGCVPADPAAEDANYAQTGHFAGLMGDVRLYARALTAEEVQAQYAEGAAGRFRPANKPCAPVRPEATGGVGALRLAADARGVVQVTTPQGFCLVESSWSYPAGGRIGYNAFAQAASENPDPAWTPRVSRLADGALRIEAAGALYAVQRTVRVRDGRVEFEDLVANTSDKPVGLLVRHAALARNALRRPEIGSGGADPFVFGEGRDFNLGVVAEDPISRIHFAPFAVANEAGYSIGHYALDAGKTHAFRFSVYPLDRSEDAWALLNKVRAHWGVNHTLLGPCSFYNLNDPRLDNPEQLAAALKRMRLGVCMLSPWLDYDPGPMDHVLTRDEYKALAQKAMKALKAADPSVKVIGCIETDWITLHPDQIKNGDKLPVHKGGASGVTLATDEQAQVLRESGLPWLDSMVVTKEGKIRLEIYTRAGKPQLALCVIPGPGNYQEKFLLDQARFLIEDCGLDGFYIDEFCPHWYRSYHTWDGSTADIDAATGEILERYTHPVALGFASRLALCKYAADRGKVMVANTYGMTTEETGYPTQRFAETGWAFHTDVVAESGKPVFNANLASSRLNTPIGLGMQVQDSAKHDGARFLRGIITYLRHGMVYYHYILPPLPDRDAAAYGVVNRMFPLTPVRIFEGGLEGKERTITCISGKFQRPGPAEPRVTTFDAAGREKPSQVRLMRSNGAWVVAVTVDDWNEVAIIE